MTRNPLHTASAPKTAGGPDISGGYAGYHAPGNRKALVIAAGIHAVVIGALVLMPPSVVQDLRDNPIKTIFIELPKPTPKPTPEVIEDAPDVPVKSNKVFVPDPPIDVSKGGVDVDRGTKEVDDLTKTAGTGGTVLNSGAGEGTDLKPRIPPETVFVAPRLDQRYAANFQPDYPPNLIRQELEGSVRIRVLVGPNGRVIRTEKLDASHELFWKATDRKARSSWRFLPATSDGTPVEGWFTITVKFTLDQK